MKIDKYISKAIKADDLKDGPRLITIVNIEEKTFGGDEKLVMSVEEFEQDIPLNKTALLTLTEIFGSDETNDWVGEKVVVFRDPNVMYQGRRVGGIAFRKPKDGTTLAPAKVKEEDLPF